MPEKEYLPMNMGVRARMTVADEIRRQKRLGLDVINEKVVEGLIEQRQYLENQQTQTLKSLVLLVFLSFVAWQGGNIKIPGTGASIAEVPAFLEISLVLSALILMWLPYLFLCIQTYEGVIHSIVKQISAENLIDEDIVVASKMPVQLYLKYAREDVVIGRKNGFKMSPRGKIYNGMLVGLVLVAFVLMFAFLFVSVLVIAHLGLDDGFVGWSVYLLCWFVICVGVFAISANFVNSRYEMDGRSLSQEIESRLRRTFTDEKEISNRFGSRETFYLMRAIDLAIQTVVIKEETGTEWLKDSEVFDRVVRTIRVVLDSIRPPDPPSKETKADKVLLDNGFSEEAVAWSVWKEIQESDPSLPLDKGSTMDHRLALLKSELGEIAKRPELAYDALGNLRWNDAEFKDEATWVSMFRHRFVERYVEGDLAENEKRVLKAWIAGEERAWDIALAAGPWKPGEASPQKRPRRQK